MGMEQLPILLGRRQRLMRPESRLGIDDVEKERIRSESQNPHSSKNREECGTLTFFVICRKIDPVLGATVALVGVKPRKRVPPAKDGKPNDWERVPGTDNRPDKWVPRDPVPSPKGGQPGASWDERQGHWDVDDGNRNRTRWLPNGTQVDHNNNPIPMSSPGSGVVNFVRQHPVAVGVGVVVVGGTVIFLTGGAAAPALAFAF